MLKFFSSKANIYFIDVLVLLFCITGIYQVAEKAGISTRLAYSDDGIMIIECRSETINKVLLPGDIVLAINEHPVSLIEDIEFILDSFAIGQQIQLQIQRDGQRFEHSIVLESVSSPFYLVMLTLVGLIFLSLGLFVLKNRPPGDTEALVFHWISVTVCLHIMTTFGRYTIPPLYLGYVLRLIFFLASALTPVLLIHFSFLFPRIKWINYRKIIRPLYMMALLYFLYLSASFLRVSLTFSIESFHIFMKGYNIGRWFFAICLFSGVANIFHSYFRAVEESERRKLRWVILGLAIGPISFVTLWQIPQTLTSIELVPEEIILFLSAITPLTFAISIVRYHILDIDFIFNRSSVYLIVLTLIIIIYTSFIAAAAFFIGTITIRASLLISAVAAIMVALLFEPARRMVQIFVDRKFFRVQYNYRLAQRELTNQINRFIDIQSLAQFMVEKLEALLQTNGIFFITFGKSSSDWQILAGTAQADWGWDLKKELTDFTDRSLSPVMAVARFLEIGISFEGANPQVFKQNRLVLALPLRLQNTQNSGFLLLRSKKSGTLYSLEDIDLLKTVASQISLAMERISLQKDLIIQYAEKQRLDELNRLKTYFVSSVSHELQTPLTSIKMFAELLQTQKKISVKEKKDYLEIIQGESDRLSRLISNVLDISRIERGEKKYNFKKILLNDIVKSAIRSMFYQIKQNGFELETKISRKKVYLAADADAIMEALTNLIANAIKYYAKLKYICVALSSDEEYAVIRVSDKGLGISIEDQQHIFEAFYRSEDEKIQALGGVGLGLTIVQHIAEAHGGRISVDSKVGQGSTFSLFLPKGVQK